MSVKSLDDFIAIVTNPDLNTKIANRIKPKIEKYFQDSVNNAISDFYNSYSPIDYERTYNFLSIVDSARTYQFGDTIEMSVSNDGMDVYPGWWGKSLSPDASMYMFYRNGYHGYDGGKFPNQNNIHINDWPDYQDGSQLLRAVSNPPHVQVQKDVESGFNGKIYKDIQKACKDILG